MKVLVIGQGGREHALVKALRLSPSVTEVHAVPGSDGMSREALCHGLDWRDTEALIQLCLRNSIDFVLIGPEDPLVAGLADRLRERGILVFGPDQAAAQLEGSKVHAKHFMREAGVPTAAFELVTSRQEVEIHLSKFTPPYVLKADGLAAGKGVFICKTKEELLSVATDLFEKGSLGAAGKQALLEQFQPGWELSYLILTNGKEWQTLPLAQDHKRLGDHDVGPNTGGMGTIAPLSISSELREQIESKIVAPSVRELHRQGLVYRGVLFIGIMVTDQGPQVLEYNTRFGDPETQVILPLIDGDLGDIFGNLSRGQMTPLKLKNVTAACVILAAAGYPDSPQKGVLIEGDLLQETSNAYFIHAGTKKTAQGQWVVNGGRVLGAVGLGSNNQEAIENAYRLAEPVTWAGLQKRMDIGAKVLK